MVKPLRYTLLKLSTSQSKIEKSCCFTFQYKKKDTYALQRIAWSCCSFFGPMWQSTLNGKIHEGDARRKQKRKKSARKWDGAGFRPWRHTHTHTHTRQKNRSRLVSSPLKPSDRCLWESGTGWLVWRTTEFRATPVLELAKIAWSTLKMAKFRNKFGAFSWVQGLI